MYFLISGQRKKKKKYPHHGEPLLVIGMRQMPPSRGGRIESEFPQVATDQQLSLNFRAWWRRSEQRYARLLSCSLPRTGIARQLGQIGATFFESILPIFGDKGRNDLSIYLLQPRKKTSSRRSLLLRSPLRLGRCLGQEPQLVAVSIWLFFSCC